MKSLFSLALVLVISGCASSHVLVGQARDPIDPEQVRLYLDAPPNYETVALLESSNRGALNFTDQQKTNTVISRMKEEAAELGANGILLKGMGKEYAGNVGSGNAWVSGNSAYGLGVSSAVFNKVGSGIAIYVPNDVALQRGRLIDAEGISAQPVQSIIATPTAVADMSAGQASSVMVQPAKQVAPTPARANIPVERDPAKRCDACARMTAP